MKKKLGLLLLALVMVIGSLAGCSPEAPAPEAPPPPPPNVADDETANDADTPEDQAPEATDPVVPAERAFSAWNNYLELTGAFHATAVGAWAADFTSDIELDISIMTMRMLMTGHMAAIQTDEENMQLLMDMTIDMGMFGEMSMLMYLNMVDGNMTTRLILDGIEMQDDFIDADMIDEMTESMAVLPDFALGDIISVEIEEDGNYTSFHFLIDASVLNDFIQKAIGSQMGELMDMFGDDAGITFELTDDMPMTLVVYGGDDNPVSLMMEMNVRMAFDGAMFEEMDGEEMTIRMVTTYIYTAFGDDVVITPPPGGAAPGSDNFDVTFAEELLGTWDWDLDDSFTIIFYPYGTGRRNWSGEWEYFYWITLGNYLFLEVPLMEEHWAFTISNGVLDISSQQVAGMHFRYIAR